MNLKKKLLNFNVHELSYHLMFTRFAKNLRNEIIRKIITLGSYTKTSQFASCCSPLSKLTTWSNCYGIQFVSVRLHKKFQDSTSISKLSFDFKMRLWFVSTSSFDFMIKFRNRSYWNQSLILKSKLDFKIKARDSNFRKMFTYIIYKINPGTSFWLLPLIR